MGIKKADHTKSHGVVYTPEWLVDLVLDQIPEPLWTGPGWAVDFSCGDGAFLERMCERSRLAHERLALGADVLARWCSESLWGSDLDAGALVLAKARLDAWASRHGLPAVEWRLRAMDLLSPKLISALRGRCSVVVGNPPYVRIQNLKPSSRAAAQKLSFCAEGSTDLYLACYELGLTFLAPDGRLSFVAPNSWIRARAGRAMREALAKRQLTRSVIDFGDFMPFEGVGAYCAVATLGASPQPTFEVFGWDKEGRAKVDRQVVGAQAWLADPPLRAATAQAAPVPGRKGLVRLGELCKLGVGFATLADGVFISDEAPMAMDPAKTMCLFKKDGVDHWIEAAVARPLVKASTSKPPAARPTRWIIHPYALGASGRPELMAEAELARVAPKAHAYLSARKSTLLARDKGKLDPKAWHGYGRSQGLQFSFQAWAASPSLCKKPEFFEMPSHWEGLPVAFVSGLGVGFDAPSASRAALMKSLNSAAMAEHMRWAAADYAGGYKAYNKNAVKTFMVDPAEAGVLWFDSLASFAVWAQGLGALGACPSARELAQRGELEQAWAVAKLAWRDALRRDDEPAGEKPTSSAPSLGLKSGAPMAKAKAKAKAGASAKPRNKGA